MKILSLNVMPTGVAIQGKEYTWLQTWRYFAIGAFWAIGYSLPPVIWTLWHNYQTYTNPTDWTLTNGVFITAIVPAFIGYYKSHKNLLKWPPIFDIPKEFRPDKVTYLKDNAGVYDTMVAEDTQTGERVTHKMLKDKVENQPE